MNYCFGDFEFTCGGKANYIGGELLSAGIVICDESFNVLEKFYSTMKPAANKRLHKMCMEITHLTQLEIDNSQDSNVVCRKLLDMFEKYDIKNINVWGNYDVVGIKSDAKLHRRKNLPERYIMQIANMICDCQSEVIKKIGSIFNFSLSKLPEFFETTSGLTAHNSMTDAMVLFEVYKNAFCTTSARVPEYDEFIKLEQEKYVATIKDRELQRQKRISTLGVQEKQLFTEISEKYGRKIERVFFMYYRRMKGILKKNKGSDLVIFYTTNSCVIEPLKGTDIDERKNEIIGLVEYETYGRRDITHAMQDIMTHYVQNSSDFKGNTAQYVF